MESIKELYKIGYGPSSSHTMGPRFAAEQYLKEYPGADRYEVSLFGSLAATGKGHLTEEALIEVFQKSNKQVEITWHPDEEKPYHPNALTFAMLDSEGFPHSEWTAYSVGGGTVVSEDEIAQKSKVYPEELSTMKAILDWCETNGKQLWEFVLEYEGVGIITHIEKVWATMIRSIKQGLSHEGVLPGGLNLARKAPQFFIRAKDLSGPMGKRSKALAYALAVSEENAGGGEIVTAPTCGSSGVLPGVLYYMKEQYKIPHIRIIRSLLTAGLIGNLVKYNASISGAEVGCQGEIGTACAMASGAATQLLGGSIYQIEYAAEMGLEHHLGLTCDPVKGLVQIPCIERNAMAAARSLNHANFSLLSDGRHRISFDSVVEVMKETGQALPSLYRETSRGGLAAIANDTE